MAETTDAENHEQASVGVLGWLGFIIINFALWGIIATASTIAWVLGFVICLVYTLAVAGLAIYLERRDKKRYYQFLNLLWVLACTFIFVLGLYISVQVIEKNLGEDSYAVGTSRMRSHSSSDLRELLPANASDDVRAWAENTWSKSRQNVDFALFAGSLFFNGQAEGEDSRILRRSTNAGLTSVLPPVRGAAAFTEMGSSLFFTSGSGVWRVDAADLDTAVSIVDGIRDIYVDNVSDVLYFRANYYCSASTHGRAAVQGCNAWVNTLYSSDGTTAGTTDLRGDACDSLCKETGTGGGGGNSGPIRDGPSKAALWGTLFLAAVPMMAVAAFVLVRKQLPGVFANLFCGVIAVVVIFFSLSDGDLRHLGTFLKWFLTIYTSFLWAVLTAWSLWRPDPEGWKGDLKSWAVAFVGVSFFVIIHVDLEIPFTSSAAAWIGYAALTVLQMLLSGIVSRTVPMVAGAIGLFVLSWKIAFEIVQAAGIQSGEFGMLTTLAIVALQGMGIIVGAIFYAGRRDEYDEKVRSLLRCGQKVPEKSEGEREGEGA